MKSAILCLCVMLFLELPGSRTAMGASDVELPGPLTSMRAFYLEGIGSRAVAQILCLEPVDSGAAVETPTPEPVGPLTAMEALELVKERYASNFTRVEDDTGEDYYYKLPYAEYYLACEGRDGTTQDYLIHLYEFVPEDTEEGIGHYVTYGWFTVNHDTGEISELIYYRE